MRTSSLRVLLVDDDDLYWELTQLAMERSGLERLPTVERVSDGPQALEYLDDDTRALPQLVLLDQRMPRMTGTEVLAKVRAHEEWRGIPICFMSTSNQPDLVNETYRLGANLFVTKPLAFSELVETLSGLFALWTDIAEPYRT